MKKDRVMRDLDIWKKICIYIFVERILEEREKKKWVLEIRKNKVKD